MCWVVPAGVHHAGGAGGELDATFFLDRKHIDVGPQR
jgi:hypothetical protein